MVQPLVSVIIAAYNAEAWIRDTVESALHQTYSPLEVVVIDDGSADQTWRLLQMFGPRVTLLQNKKNAGVSASRNRGIIAARGEYIALLDHDDLWYPQKIELQMELFQQKPDLGLVYSDCFYQTADGHRWRSFQATPPSRGFAFDQLLHENFIPCLTAVMPAKTLHEIHLFREDLAVLEDHELFLRIARKYPIDCVEEPLAMYRIHDRNFTRRKAIYHQERLIVQSLYQCVASLYGAMAWQHIGLGIALLKDRHPGTGLQAMLQGCMEGLSHPVQFAKAGLQTCERRRRVQ